MSPRHCVEPFGFALRSQIISLVYFAETPNTAEILIAQVGCCS
jgi:hypothetical protein